MDLSSIGISYRTKGKSAAAKCGKAGRSGGSRLKRNGVEQSGAGERAAPNEGSGEQGSANLRKDTACGKDMRG